jgi:hypothetical protein
MDRPANTWLFHRTKIEKRNPLRKTGKHEIAPGAIINKNARPQCSRAFGFDYESKAISSGHV